MKKKVPLLLLGFWLAHGARAQGGNHVFTGAEAANYGTVDLATPTGQLWATDRQAVPGYFSAVGASPYASPSDADNVDGYVKQYVTAANQGYSFPVGNGTDLRVLATSGTIANNSIFATAWILGDPGGNLDPTSPNSGAHPTTSPGTGIIAVSKIGEWDWQDLNGTGNGVTITVSIPDMTSFATATNLRLVGWNGSNWQNLSGASGASGNTENSTLSGTMVSGITAIGIGSVTTVLPLDLLSFTAAQANCDAQLLWTTTNEVNTSYFDMQQSLDATSFTSIGQVKAQGTGPGKTYSFTALQPTGQAYYRLGMVDKDGTLRYSPTATLLTTCSSAENTISLYPTLVYGNTAMVLKYSFTTVGGGTVTITNGIGQRVSSWHLVLTGGPGALQISTANLAKGTYFVQLIGAGGQRLGTAQKFIKQ